MMQVAPVTRYTKRIRLTRAFLSNVAFATLCNLSPSVHFLLFQTPASSDNGNFNKLALYHFRLIYQRLPVQSAQAYFVPKYRFSARKKNDGRKIFLCDLMQNVIQEYCWSIIYELKGITNGLKMNNAHK